MPEMTDKIATLTQVEPEVQALTRLIGTAISMATVKRRDTELSRANTPAVLAKVRAKNAAKEAGSPLPGRVD